MYWKTLLVVIGILAFSFFAHSKVEATRSPSLGADNERLRAKVAQYEAITIDLNKAKDGYAHERDRAVDELNQLKALARVVSTQPVAGK